MEFTLEETLFFGFEHGVNKSLLLFVCFALSEMLLHSMLFVMKIHRYIYIYLNVFYVFILPINIYKINIKNDSYRFMSYDISIVLYIKIF